MKGMRRKRTIFTPPLLSNQVKVTLFIGMAAILLPLFHSSSQAEPASEPEPAVAPLDDESEPEPNLIDDGAFHVAPDEAPMVARVDGGRGRIS